MYAQVIVDIASSDVDRVFDYQCDDSVEAGMRVLVPFGKRECEGYVISISDTTDFELSKIKSIIRSLDNMPATTVEQLLLKDWMRAAYNLKAVDVLRLFIPPQMRGDRVKELTRMAVFVSDQYKGVESDKIIKPNSFNQRQVFEYLSTVPHAYLSQLQQEYSLSAINNLVAKGILSKIAMPVVRVPASTGLSNCDVVLTEQQQSVVDFVCSQSNKTILLHGVTGSGKTQVYMHLIAHALAQDKTAIMLVPEIGLTPQTLRLFKSRFGDSVALIHSGLSAGERFDEWKRVLLGEAKVVCGARSAIFVPLKNIGIIVIDEEHDTSYQSESNPRYNTREIAKWRSKYNKCNLVMGSATPSIESYHSAKCGQYMLQELPHRINARPMPHIEIVDMRQEVYKGNNSPFSEAFLSGLNSSIKSGDKAMVFINRRGYSSYVMCRGCGYVAKCADCDVSLVYHKEDNLLKCHYCQHRYAVLDDCPECSSSHIRRGFVGTEQVVEKLKEYIGNVKILRMDNDTTQGKDAHLKIMQEFAYGEAQVLVGTQMIAKGHDIPSVTFVGIVDADMSLYFADYRAIERTYQLITQVAGRAGRDVKNGRIVLQTYSPNHYVYRFAIKYDYVGFFAKENNLREVTKYPPYSTIIRVLISSLYEEYAQDLLKKVFDDIVQVRKNNEGFFYLACMRSPIKRIQQKHRMQILMRVRPQSCKNIQPKVYDIVNRYSTDKCNIYVEINPGNLS